MIGSFIVVSIILALRCLQDINTLNYNSGWALMILIALVVFVLYEMSTTMFKFKKKSEYITLFLLPIFTFAYGFGTVTMVNALGDDARPTVYQTEVIAKRVSTGKSTTYYLELKSWGDLQDNKEVSVARWMYNDTSVGDEMMVDQYPGLLKMEWKRIMIS